MVFRNPKHKLGLETLGPLFIFGVSGLISVALDIDHLIALAWFSETGSWRLFHIPVGIAAGIVFLSVGTCCGGLYIKHLLRRYKRNEQI